MNKNELFLIDLLGYAVQDKKPKTFDDDIDIYSVYNIANRQHLLHTIYEQLEFVGYNKIPPELLKRWKTEYIANKARDVRQQIACDEVVEKLASNGVKVMPLKGILIKKLYRNTYLRRMSDLDILIHKEDKNTVIKLLESMGYSFENDGKKHFSFSKRPGINIEIHINLFSGKFDSYFDNIWENANEAKKNVFIMANEDLFLHTVLHYAEHFYHTGIGIRAVTDIFVLSKTYPDVLSSKRFIEVLSKTKLSTFFESLLKISNFWFSDVENDNSLSKIEEYLLSSSTYGTVEGLSIEYARKLSEKRSSRFGIIISVLFPSYKDMCSRFSCLKRMPILLPICWIIRLARVPVNAKTYPGIIKEISNVDAKKIKSREEINNFLGFSEVEI